MSLLSGALRRPRREAAPAILAVCVAAVVPYLPTLGDYFVRDDFGVVKLLASKPASYFPTWFHTSWMDTIWGYLPDEIRPFPALSYQLTALGGPTATVPHHVLNIVLHAANGLLVLAIARHVAGLTVVSALFAAVAFSLLPAHPESVAWITGRVDSMPALFYMASFYLYARWRQGNRSPDGQPARGIGRYVWSLVLFFLALFTKQNTITMVGTLVAYDVIVRRDLPLRGGVRRVASWLAPYVPFVLMTAGYLGLRYALFGHVVRENQLTAAALRDFAGVADRHLARVVAGDPDGSRLLMWLAIATVCVVAAVARRSRGNGPSTAALLLFFGPVWWVIGVAPAAAAGYESPRHVYLAAAGWAVTLGIAFDALWRAREGRAWRRACLAAAAVVLGAYGAQLWQGVRAYNEMAAVSRKAILDITAEGRHHPAGSLVIVGVPRRSWDWALPFALQPPYARVDLTKRDHVIWPWALNCCFPSWPGYTRRALAAWSSGPAAHSVVLMRWDERTGQLSKVDALQNPELPSLARALLAIESPRVLDTSIWRMLDELVK